MNKLRGIYAITTPTLLSSEYCLDNLSNVLVNIALLQYRNKDKADLDQATVIQQLCIHYQVPFIVNDDIELAKQLHADGIHLGQNDTKLDIARQQLGKQAIIGVTCHNSIELALRAEAAGADYVSFGCFFPSQTKPHAKLADLSILSIAKEQLSIPIVAIGGINQDNIAQISATGVDMIAMGEGLFHYKT